MSVLDLGREYCDLLASCTYWLVSRLGRKALWLMYVCMYLFIIKSYIKVQKRKEYLNFSVLWHFCWYNKQQRSHRLCYAVANTESLFFRFLAASPLLNSPNYYDWHPALRSISWTLIRKPKIPITCHCSMFDPRPNLVTESCPALFQPLYCLLYEFLSRCVFLDLVILHQHRRLRRRQCIKWCMYMLLMLLPKLMEQALTSPPRESDNSVRRRIVE